ncbi:hypothetical protein [Pleionea sp. CnH1-48]|uniref:hypothetical protein n=1 Tax=Pleionea sp. CnH1-48 TaxID=2954494 RepID=UPI0020971002|nr:hypothetical protein [Pleionea sp. CnH1-48]MCO7226960.1 hypothetical protein [Pleionea sp. CnH1-48]
MKHISLFFAFIVCSFVVAKPLSLQHFAKFPAYNQIKLSPDGKHIAATAPYQDQTILVILDAEKLKVKHAFGLKSNEHIKRFYWVSNKRVIFTHNYKEGYLDIPVTDGQIFAGDIEGTNQRIIFSHESSNATGRLNSKDREPSMLMVRSIKLSNSHFGTG